VIYNSNNGGTDIVQALGAVAGGQLLLRL